MSACVSACAPACVSISASARASDHHVSPWGQRPDEAFAAYLRAPDLAVELALVDAETASLGLKATDEIRAELPARGARTGSGEVLVLRGYVGRDAGGRAVHATRAVTARSIVLAVGPLDAGDVDRGHATELCPTVPPIEGASGLVFRSGVDLNGDGLLDVVLRNDAGELSIWHVGAIGSGAYPVISVAPPTRGADVDGDGRLDLWGELPTPPADPIAPRLTDVATFEAGAYSDTTAAARAWHAQAVKPLPTKVTDTVRLRAALEHAWHALLSGQPSERASSDLAREPVPPALRASFERHQRAVAAIPPR